MKLEKLISSAEEHLSIGAAIPFVGMVPGALKVGMGGTQLISGVACTIIFSIATLFNSEFKSLRERSISHIAHGAANVVAGIIEGIPFAGLIVFIVRATKSKVMGKKIKDIDILANNSIKNAAARSPLYNALWGKKYDRDPENYVLVSPNNFKFMGYQRLQDDQETYYQEQKAYYHSLNSQDSIDPTIVPCSKKKEFQEKNANARFYDAPWGPVVMC